MKKDFKSVMSGLKIPFFDLSRQYKAIRNEILCTQDYVYSSGRMLDGNCVEQFEDAIAIRCKRKYAVAVNSCTQALVFANLITKDGSNVMIPPVSFIATANSVWMANRNVNFADVDSQGLITNIPSTHPASTLLYVDLYGNMVDLNKINWDRETIIEDAAQSFGASCNGKPAGSFGDISCLSFDPMKNLPNYGSGGMLLTNKKSFYQKALILRDNGKLVNKVGTEGTNSKMSESDCACMLVKLRYFDSWQKRRTEIADYYSENIAEYVIVPRIEPNVIPSWHKYVIQSDRRNDLKMYLERKGIETKIHYEKPIFRTKNATKLCNRVLSLPIYPELSDEEVEYIVKSIRKI